MSGDGGRSAVILGSIIVASVLLLMVLGVLGLMVLLDPVPDR